MMNLQSMHHRVLHFNQELNQAAQANLQASSGLSDSNLKLYTPKEMRAQASKIEKVFVSYFGENPIHKVLDQEGPEEESKIEVEYMHGSVNDARYIVEFDKRARVDLQARRKDKFTLEELLRKLDTQRLKFPYFRRICQMEYSPRDLIIKVMYPSGQTDIYDWSLHQHTYTTDSIKVCISRGKEYQLTFYGVNGYNSGKFINSVKFGQNPTDLVEVKKSTLL